MPAPAFRLASVFLLGLGLGCADTGPEPYFADRVAETEERAKEDGFCTCPSLCTPSPVMTSTCAPLGPLEAAVVAELGASFGIAPGYVCGYQGGDSVETACGPASADNAFVCPADGGVLFDQGLLADKAAQFGDFGAVVVLAHEWGHLLQAQFGVLEREDLGSKQLELQADCLAGVFTALQEAKGHLNVGDIGEGATALCSGGDPSWRPVDGHGTCIERAAFFDTGLQRGRQSMANICVSSPAEIAMFLCGV